MLRFYNVKLRVDRDSDEYIELNALIREKDQESGRFSFTKPVMETLFYEAFTLECIKDGKRVMLARRNEEMLSPYLESEGEGVFIIRKKRFGRDELIGHLSPANKKLKDVTYEVVRKEIIKYLARGGRKKETLERNALRDWNDAVEQILHHVPLEWDAEPLGDVEKWGEEEWRVAFAQYEKVCKTKTCFKEIKNILMTLSEHPQEIHRAMSVFGNPSKFLMEIEEKTSVGRYWTLEEGLATPIWSVPDLRAEDLYFAVARGHLTSIEMVDQADTLMINVIYECSEKEIRLKSGSWLKVDKLKIYRITNGYFMGKRYHIEKFVLHDVVDVNKEFIIKKRK